MDPSIYHILLQYAHWGEFGTCLGHYHLILFAELVCLALRNGDRHEFGIKLNTDYPDVYQLIKSQKAP